MRILSPKPVVGARYGRLTVIDEGGIREPLKNRGAAKPQRLWHVLVRCDCGTEKLICWRNIWRGLSRSCGCLEIDLRGTHSVTHGGTNTPLYGIWRTMRQRCNNPATDSYPNYGGRGITVCDEWKNDFAAFAKWAMGNGHQDGLQIDRIDNDKGYSPDNCRIVDSLTNCLNRRNTAYATAWGETKPIRRWAEDPRCKVCFSSLQNRIYVLGWPHEKAISTPPRPLRSEKTLNDRNSTKP